MNVQQVEIATIKVGERKRADFGDIAGLAASIASHGQLQPIVIDQDNNLVAGERRLRAHIMLKKDTIFAVLREDLDEESRLEIELEENVQRKDFTWVEEIIALKDLYELKQKKYGGRIRGVTASLEGNNGFGTQDAAALLGRSEGSISMDLQLARGLSEYPELAKEQTKSAAFKRLKRARETLLRSELAKRTRLEDLVAASSPAETPIAGDVAPGGSDSERGDGATTTSDTPPQSISNIRKVGFKGYGLIYNGDSRTVLRSLPSSVVDCVVTDPPYALGLASSTDANTSGRRLGEHHGGIYDDDPHRVLDMLDVVMREAGRILKPDGHAYVFFHHAWYEEMFTLLTRAFGEGTVTPTPLVWVKNTPGIGDPNRSWVYSYEACFFVNRGRPLVKPQAFNHLAHSTVPPQQKIHPTEKPTSLLRHIIEASCVKGETILEPFGGSGSTLHAAVDLGVKFMSCELDKDYFERIIDRMSRVIGAVQEADDATQNNVSNVQS